MSRTKKKTYPRLNLDPSRWLRNTTDIKNHREKLKKKHKNKCEVTGETLIRPSVDHCHDTGYVRGLLSGFTNTLEGRYRYLFNKYARKHTSMSFPDFLISLGNYLKRDPSSNPLHFKIVQDKRTTLYRMRKDTLLELIYSDFSVDLRDKCDTMTKDGIVDRYLKYYIMDLEGEL